MRRSLELDKSSLKLLEYLLSIKVVVLKVCLMIKLLKGYLNPMIFLCKNFLMILSLWLSLMIVLLFLKISNRIKILTKDSS